MSNKSGTSSQMISLPKGGGALQGIGETFAPDLFTGTGNFTIPIALPHGRNGFQPQLSLVYSTGHGNGPFGLGWNLSIPGISRKTSKGIPRYDDAQDVFVLSGAEDLVPVETTGTTIRYRPRTEGLFAQILHRRDATNSYWQVRSTDGLSSLYGTPASLGTDPATIADPSNRRKVFAWKLTRTQDPFGNRIDYEYQRDTSEEGPHHWDQLDLARICYVDYGDDQAEPRFLVMVEFLYEPRPDPLSEYRSGFEIRTRQRCTNIVVRTHAEEDRKVRTYDLVYLDQRPELTGRLPLNGVSLLSQIKATGYDGEAAESLPPLEFGYTRFEPERRKFLALQGADLPARSLANSELDLVDLFGNGLPDLIEMNGAVRYWRNFGNGRFDVPRFMQNAPAGVALADAGVQFVDANGDGRTDLLVTTAAQSGYFPLSFDGAWDRRSFQRYQQAPSFDLEDPEVRLVDLDGDGVTDAVRSGSRFECFFNSPQGWTTTRWVERQAIEVFPNVNFSDLRVKWADMTGDGLQDIALVYDGNVEYWPNLGHGNWGKRIHMENSPRFPYGYDPRRILVGDVDGDGLADIVYVDDTRITLWVNQSGNRWSDPITILGTPSVSDMDAVRLVDVLGSGISGVLWSRDANGWSRDHLFFFDFTGGLKPYLLNEMDNHIGAITKVEYTASTHYYLEDQKHPDSRWNTTLSFPVHVVSRVEVIDYFSKGKLTTEYRYHQGHWDGAEREFHGFGMVEQLDTESFEKYDNSGLHGAETFFAKVDRQHFSPPTLSKTWFHLGPVGGEFGDWRELDWSNHYWEGDPQLLKHTETINQFLQSWSPTSDGRRVKRDALRTLRGSILRTELYALDGSDREERPYTVAESSYGLMEVDPPVHSDTNRLHVFFPHNISTRTTQWERGNDPMTQFSFTRYTDDAGEFDPFGRPLAQTQIACPRGWRTMSDRPVEPYLATRSRIVYAEPNDLQVYIHNRVGKTTSFEIVNTSGKRVIELAAIKDSGSELKLIGQTLSFYDGEAFVGLPLGQLGKFGALTRSESLVLTDEILQQAYGAAVPPYVEPSGNPAWIADYPAEFRTLLPRRAGYIFHAGSADPSDPKGYFVDTDRRRYDFQTDPVGAACGMVLEILHPLHDEAVNPTGHRTTIAYDKYQFLPIAVTDAAGLTTQARYDYRVLQATELTDSNDNKSRFAFSPLGLLESSFIGGKGPTEGDQARPSVRLEYNFLAFENSPPENRQPAYVRTICHVHHDTELDIALPRRDETITSVQYTDGFGRLLQSRAQAEKVRFGDEHFGGGESVLPAAQSDGAGADVVGRRNADAGKPNVVVSGWQVYDNKGRVVERYEPFFSEGWEYGQPDDRKTGQKVTTFYDPRGQVIRRLNPDGSQQRVVYGTPGTVASPDLSRPEVFEPTPWEAYTYDANDNASRTLSDASAYRHHCDTPASILIDALGRTVEAVERNRDLPANPADPLPPIQEVCTRMTYDIRGNVVTATDALGRTAFRYVFDIANNTLRIDSIDGGWRYRVLNAEGGVVEQRDRKDALTLHSYDGLGRPLRLWARDGEGQKLTLRERLEYGDAGSPDQPAGDRANRRASNQLGKRIRQFDEAGLLTFGAYDFKGNLLEKTRRVVSDTAILSVFSGPPPGWQVETFRVDWSSPAAVPLDPQDYVSTVRYDALGRIKLLIYPEDVENQRRRLKPQYNATGALERIELERSGAGGAAVSDTFVEHIAYNAKGQRLLIAYGNGVMTRHAYDPHTFRLLRLRTEAYSRPSELTYRPTGAPLQELAYEYDLAGNILNIRERSPGCGIRNTALGEDALDRQFTYDALYRLCSATGRECDHPPDFPWAEALRCADLTKTRAYTEQYSYDALGNVGRLKHLADGAGFSRDFEMADGSNRLQTLTVGAAVTHFDYDENGNVIRESSSRHFEWDYADCMRAYRTQAGVGEPSVYAHYLYDASGRRAKKLIRKQGGKVEVTVYIDGVFEKQRIVQGGVEENNTLHIMDSQRRIALVRVGAAFSGDGAADKPVKYHLGDHLGSSSIVIGGLNAAARDFINREEYTPYGETSFGSFARKRYRYSGKERDEESGLNHHGRRYYAPWLARWTSCDPAGPVAGFSLYPYTQNPIRFVDPQGTKPGQGEIPIDTGNIIEDRTTITIIKHHPPAAPPAQTSHHGSVRPADEPDTPGQMPHGIRGVAGPVTPTTAAIGQSEVPTVSPEPGQSDAPTLMQSINDFREGLLHGMAQGVPVYGWFVEPDSFLRHDKQAYEIGRGLGQIAMGIVDMIVGGGMISTGAGGAVAGTATGPGEIVIGPVGAAVALAGAAIAVNGAVSVAAGLKTIANAMSMGGGAPAKKSVYYRDRYNEWLKAQGKKPLPEGSDWRAHHRIPQDYRNHPEFKDFDIDDPTNIRGIRDAYHNEISKHWADFKKQNPNATGSEIEDFAQKIDRGYKHLYWKGK